MLPLLKLLLFRITLVVSCACLPMIGYGADMKRLNLAELPVPLLVPFDSSSAVWLMEGPFEVGDYLALQKLVYETRQSNTHLMIMFNSSGGVLKEGLKIGALLQAHAHVSTWVLPNMSCESACAFAFLGSTSRHVMPGGRLGLHRPFFESSAVAHMTKRQIEKEASFWGVIIYDYFQLFGLDTAMLYKSFEYDHSQMWILSDVEIDQYQVNTTQVDYDVQLSHIKGATENPRTYNH